MRPDTATRIGCTSAPNPTGLPSSPTLSASARTSASVDSTVNSGAASKASANARSRSFAPGLWMRFSTAAGS